MNRSTCGCCSGVDTPTPQPEENRPGLPTISFRVGSYGSFFESMVARLSTLSLSVPASDTASAAQGTIYPLRALTTREASDPAIALLDAWAIVADVLSFYSERIANEGYLRTATEHRSILELAGLLGYRLRPAISASVYLAFTVADGFRGIIPAGARAQSIPGPGEQPQFFESSFDLPARDTWNALKPRLTRPQTITFSPDPAASQTAGIDAGSRDTLFFKGITSNLNPGDFILIVANDDAAKAKLRRIASVDVQNTEARTLAVLEPPPILLTGDSVLAKAKSLFQPYIDDAAGLFAEVDLAHDVAALLTTLLSGIEAGSGSSANASSLALAAVPQVQAWHDLAATRHFTRLEPWLAGLLQALQAFARGVIGPVGKLVPIKQILQLSRPGVAAHSVSPSAASQPDPSIGSLQANLPPSALTGLTANLALLAKPPSLQPGNSLQLARTVSGTFSRQSELAPRLLASLYPRAASSIYKALAGAQSPANHVAVSALRVKAGLFAASSSGPARYSNNTLIGFGGVSIAPAWGSLTDGSSPLPVVALDAVYDKIKAGTWIAITRPALSPTDKPTTYHLVTAVNTVTLSALAAPQPTFIPGGIEPRAVANTPVPFGFTAKSTQLTVDPPWLQELGDKDVIRVLDSGQTLGGTTVYAQAEPLELAEEPLDNDVEGSTLELAGLYDGLDSGRWIVVSGERTDIPNTSGVSGSELVMIASVKQGSRSVPLTDFPPGLIPFSSIAYITDANASGDRLAVGRLAAGIGPVLQLPTPTVPGQGYSDEVQLAPGVFASVYVPTVAERGGNFSDFAGLLVHPDTNQPLPGGIIPDSQLNLIFAWRVSTQPVHTILTLANALAYRYDPATVTINANVVPATNGQTTGEVLGSGAAGESLQTFPLHQSPLTFLPAATPFGAQNTLTVRVNEVAWSEAENLVALGPRDRSFVLDTDDADQVSVVFGTGSHGARVPTGSGNVKATYRYGSGSAGNVAALQVSQLATQPLGVKGVINPLAASGGADGDTTDQARRNIPTAVLALDRLVSVGDYADFARAYAGIAKSSSTLISDGRRTTLHLTVAGNGDIAVEPSSDLYRSLVQALLKYGDPAQPLEVAGRASKLLVLAAGVRIFPAYTWESVAPALRAALLALFSFDARDLGQSAFLSEAIAAMQAVDGVQSVNVTTFDAVPDTITGAQLPALGSTLRLNPVITAQLARANPIQTGPTQTGAGRRILPAQIAFFDPTIPDTLILTEIKA